MSLAPYPLIPKEPEKKYRTRKRPSLRYSERNTHLSSVNVSSLKREQIEPISKHPSKIAPKISPQLRFMLQLQKASSVMTFGLVVVTLGIYAWTVYVPKLWSKEYRNLETLQRHERHLTAANESIKNQLAKQAEDAKAGLTNPKPDQAIFLPQTPVPPPVLDSTKANSAQNPSLLGSTPVSY